MKANIGLLLERYRGKEVANQPQQAPLRGALSVGGKRVSVPVRAGIEGGDDLTANEPTEGGRWRDLGKEREKLLCPMLLEDPLRDAAPI